MVQHAALELWRAPDRFELFTRDVATDLPKPVRERMREQYQRSLRGERVREEWIMYPGGVQITVMLDLKLVTLANGELGTLLQAEPVVCAPIRSSAT